MGVFSLCLKLNKKGRDHIMNNVEKIINDSIQQAVNNGDYAAIAELSKALAAIKNAENLEKIISVFAELGVAAKHAANQLDPAMITDMMKQQRLR